MANLARFQRGFGRRKPGPWARVDGSHPLARGLVGCWLMNEGGGATVRDLSGKNLTGTRQPQVAYTTGNFSGGALSFTGSGNDDVNPNGYVDFGPNPTPLQFGSGSFAVVAWFKAGVQTSNYPNLVCNTVDGGTAAGFQVGMFASADTTYVFASDGTNTAQATVNGACNNLWHQIVGVANRQAGTLQLYLDGAAASSVSLVAVGNVNGGSNFVFGMRSVAASQDQHYAGLLDHVLIWNRSLGAAEIQQLYQQPFAFLQQAPPRQSFAFPAAAVGTPGPYYYLFTAGMGG